MHTGPLAGVRIVEIAGIGPAPYAAMLLADLGAEVLRIERKEGITAMKMLGMDPLKDVSNRGRRAVALDLKDAKAVELVLEAIERADVLIEGFRPGVMERLGLGPDVCLARNPRLVYARMTGWGQDGPLAKAVGHDINYIALSGMLSSFARHGERPLPPGNLVGDMAGGGLTLAFGIACALFEARGSGRGQIIDTAMFEGAANLGVSLFTLIGMGLHDPSRPGTNMSDTGSPFYDVYETADARYVAVGAIEPPFYAALLRGLGLEASELPAQLDRKAWPQVKQLFTAIFRSRTRDEWESIFAGTDACVTPVLTPEEAARHPHALARQSFSRAGGVLQPTPVPRFSRTPGEIRWPPGVPGPDGDQALRDWGFDGDRLDALRAIGALY